MKTKDIVMATAALLGVNVSMNKTHISMYCPEGFVFAATGVDDSRYFYCQGGALLCLARCLQVLQQGIKPKGKPDASTRAV